MDLLELVKKHVLDFASFHRDDFRIRTLNCVDYFVFRLLTLTILKLDYFWDLNLLLRFDLYFVLLNSLIKLLF